MAETQPVKKAKTSPAQLDDRLRQLFPRMADAWYARAFLSITITANMSAADAVAYSQGNSEGSFVALVEELTAASSSTSAGTRRTPPRLELPQGYSDVASAALAVAEGKVRLQDLEGHGVSLAMEVLDRPGGGVSPRPVVARVLQHIFGSWLQPGVDPEDGLRQGSIDELVILYLGDRFKYVDREVSGGLMVQGAGSVYERQQGAKTLKPDRLKEKPAFLAFLSVAGSGKTTAASNLLGIGLKAVEQRPPWKSSLPLESIRACVQEHMTYRFDFTEANNSFQAVDNHFKLLPRASLSLRILFMLLGGGTTKPAPDLKEHLGSFLDFMTWVNRQPYSKLLMQYLTVQHVVLMARMVWQDTPRHNGMLHFVLDEACSQFEGTKEDQSLPTSGANRFLNMLSEWGSQLQPSTPPFESAPLLLSVAGTRMDATTVSQLASTSGGVNPMIVPLQPLSTEACLDILHDVAARLGGMEKVGDRAERLMEIIAFLSGGSPRLLEALVAAFVQVSTNPGIAIDGVQMRENIPRSGLQQVLVQGAGLQREQLEQACTMAAEMVVQRTQTLMKYVEHSNRKDIGHAILWKQLHQQTVRRDDLVGGIRDLTWGDLEASGLVFLRPASMRLARRAVEPELHPEMPYLWFVEWNKKLQARNELPNLGTNCLTATYNMFLYLAHREKADLGMLLLKLFIWGKWFNKVSVPVTELLPLKPGTPAHTHFAQCHVQVPLDNQFSIKQEHSWTSEAELGQLLKCSNLQHVAYCGPGNAPSVDWWLILSIHKEDSKGDFRKMRKLLVQGQTKKRDSLNTPLRCELVLQEKRKQFKACGSSALAASLFVYITDESLPPGVQLPDDQHDMLIISSDRHDAFYGRMGSLKRQVVSKATAAEKVG